MQLDDKTKECNHLRVQFEEKRAECLKIQTEFRETEDRFFRSDVKSKEEITKGLRVCIPNCDDPGIDVKIMKKD